MLNLNLILFSVVSIRMVFH